MADSEFISVLRDAIAAAGGAVVGVSIGANGEIQSFASGQFAVESADQVSRELVYLAALTISLACNKLGHALEIRQPVPNQPRINARLNTFDLTTAATILHVRPSTVREKAAAGLIPAAKVGRGWRFTEEALAEYLRSEIEKQTEARRGEKPAETRLEEKSQGPGRYPSGRRRPAPPPPLDGSMTKIG